jgi:hypothetical protein
MQLEDGKGTGRKAEINLSNQLSTFSIVETEFLSVNANDEKAFVWDYPAYNYDAADTVMWLRNDSDLNLHIHHIFLYSNTATVVQLHIPDNVTPAGNAITGSNINITSGITAEATAYQDETVGSQGTVLQTEYIPANGTLSILKEEGYEIILGKNDVIAIDLVTVGSSTFGHIVGYYK